MEIHAPKPVHSWRDFLKEVGIIVLGVLIALSAEQAVEALHWHNKIASAEQAMRLELRDDDGREGIVRLAAGRCLDSALVGMQQAAARHATTAELRALAAAYHPPLRVWDSEAWKTVISSDVGTHMSAERLVQWSAPYRLLPYLSELNAREGEYVADLSAALPATGNASTAELAAFRRVVAQLRRVNDVMAGSAHMVLVRTDALGAGLAPAARDSLTALVRGEYGACAYTPQLRSMPLTAVSGTADLRRWGLEQ